MGVVLPREADPAVNLDVELSVVGEAGQRQGAGDGAGQLELLAVADRPRRIPDRRRRHLGGDSHVGAVVLDRLEHADRTTELDPVPGVVTGAVDALLGPTGGLGGDDGAGQRERPPAAAPDEVRSAAPGSSPDGPVRPGAVGSMLVGTVTLRPGAPARTIDEVVADGEHEDVGQTGAEHHPGVAVDHDRAVARGRGGQGQVAVEADRTRRPPVGQAGEQIGLLGGGAQRRHHRRGDHGRDERAGRHGPAELLDHDDELGRARSPTPRTPRGGAGRATPTGPCRPRTRDALRCRPRAGPGRRPGPCGRRGRPEPSTSSWRWSSVMAMAMGLL